jgi:hypothetical protein
MTTLNDLFREYLTSIEPDPQKAVARAAKSHKPLREALEKDTTFGQFVVSTMLSGSYGRDTAIFHIKDVDVILKTSLSPNYLEDNKRDSETAQEYLLRLTQEAIKRADFEIVESTRKARRSIFVKLKTDMDDDDLPQLTMDVVPVLVQSYKDSDPMLVADRGSDDTLCGWYDTYPNTQLSDSVDRNQASNTIGDRHLYKPLVKIMKAWKRVHFSSKKTPKGFILECLTAEFHNRYSQSWIDAVRDLFQNVANQYPNPQLISIIPDVGDISNSSPHRIPIAKTVDEAKEVLETFHTHLQLLLQAVTEAETDLDVSAKTLQRIFGQDREIAYFPLPSDLANSEANKSSSPLIISKSNVREAPQFG